MSLIFFGAGGATAHLRRAVDGDIQNADNHYCPLKCEGHMVHQVNIEVGDDVLFSTGMSKEEFSAEARFLLAAKLYELGRLTLGQAAKLCGKGRVDFLCSLPRIGVSISNLRPEDAASEADFILNG